MAISLGRLTQHFQTNPYWNILEHTGTYWNILEHEVANTCYISGLYIYIFVCVYVCMVWYIPIFPDTSACRKLLWTAIVQSLQLHPRWWDFSSWQSTMEALRDLFWILATCGNGNENRAVISRSSCAGIRLILEAMANSGFTLAILMWAAQDFSDSLRRCSGMMQGNSFG